MIESIWRRMLAAMATIMEKKKLYSSSLDVNNCDCQLSPKPANYIYYKAIHIDEKSRNHSYCSS